MNELQARAEAEMERQKALLDAVSFCEESSTIA